MRTYVPFRLAALTLAVVAATACSDQGSGPTSDGSSGVGRDAPPSGGNAKPNALPPGVDPIAETAAPGIDMDASHYPKNVWITSAMAKVRRDDAIPAGAKHWAILAAARNEVESFQVHVHGDGKALNDVSVEVAELVGARAGGKIAADAITVSRELYLDIPANKKSDANGMSGAVPDGLLPARDPYFGEARKAFPMTVDADRAASAWIDVRVAPGTPADYYTGQVRVLAGGQPIATMPIRLKVWNVDLPSTATLRTNFGLTWNGACVQHYGSYDACGPAAGPGKSADDGIEYLHALYARFALDHRVSLGGVVYAPPRGNWAHFDAVYGPLLDGTAQTKLAGAKLTSIDYSGPTDAASLADWAAHFRSKGWLDRTVFYHCDEPASGNSCNFQEAFDEESAVHSAASDLRTLLTADIESISSHGLLDTVDVLTPVLDNMQPHGEPSHRAKYDAFLQRSPQKALYWYQSCDQHESCDRNGSPGPKSATWPSYMADASPMRNRVFQWMAYTFDVHGELYYLSDLCFNESCGGSRDPFQSIYAFSGHGDGTLFYPGKPSVIGGQHDVPLSSIRFELIREGLEDYELLHLLDAAGDGAFVKSSIATFVRRADDFDDDPTNLERAREILGDRLHARSLMKP